MVSSRFPVRSHGLSETLDESLARALLDCACAVDRDEERAARWWRARGSLRLENSPPRSKAHRPGRDRETPWRRAARFGAAVAGGVAARGPAGHHRRISLAALRLKSPLAK